MEVMNVKEMAKYLHCSIMSIRRMIYNKEIPYFMVGNRYLFKKSSIDSYVANCEVTNMQLPYTTEIRNIK